MNIRDELQEMYPDTMLLFMTEEEFDEAIIGVGERLGEKGYVATVVYDYDKVIEANMKLGMDYEEAVEYFGYNQMGAYVGEQTPIFVTRPESKTEE